MVASGPGQRNGGRIGRALILALLAGLAIRFYDPVAHLRADLAADALDARQGLARALGRSPAPDPALGELGQPRPKPRTAVSISQ
jgi:hypothetical protein